MCGIIGYIGDESAAPILINGLKKLEYRGYDSAGIAVNQNHEIDIVKKKGKVSVLEKEVSIHNFFGETGIGHTRWATHGEPSDTNSHPHMGGKGKIAVVHNGIIENYKELKEKLQSSGIEFKSETDSEVVAQLAEQYYEGDLLDTAIRVISELKGSYALVFMAVDEPDKLVAVKKDSPLIVGSGDSGNLVASDIPAILQYSKDVYYLDENEIVVLEKNSSSFYDCEKNEIEKQPEKIDWNADSAEKADFDHFMLKEIYEQPKVVSDTINSMLTDDRNKEVFANININEYSKITIIGCGSAYHVGMISKYIFEKLVRIPVEVDLASEFRYRNPIVDEQTLIISISQSGETADTIAALREAKAKGAMTLSIVNVIGSTLARESDFVIYTLAGPEISVATTKAFSTQLAVIYILAFIFALQADKIELETANDILKEVKNLSSHIEEVIDNSEPIKEIAKECAKKNNIFFIGRNIDYAIAMEGSLKLKEISYINSEAYAGGELKHGTISLIEDGSLIIALSTVQSLEDKIQSNIEQVISRGADVILITDSDKIREQEHLEILRVPKTEEILSGSLSVVLLQILSYYTALEKGCDIDKPRNLAKSVTVE